MKRAIFLTVILLVIHSPAALASVPGAIKTKYKAALVMEADSGKILFADRSNNKVIPASLVKMMVALITMEMVEAGEASLDSTYQVSASASRIGGHQVYLKQDEVFGLGELLKAVVIGSANDAAYAIAEHLAGTESAFVDLMNQRAKQLGMVNTRFANAHGLPPKRGNGKKDNITTAYDTALLAKELTKFPLILKWSSTRLDSFRNGTFQLLNTNHRFLRGFEGADGLKTGYHSRGAGFSMVGTAVRKGRRLLAVVMGAKSAVDRLKAAVNLLDLGFAGKL